MNVLYFTNNFPSNSNPTAGIFLYHRIVELSNLGVKTHVVSYRHTGSKINFLKFKINSLLKGKRTFESFVSQKKLTVKISNIISFGEDKFPNYKFDSLRNMQKIADDLYYEYKKSNSQLIHVHFLWYAYPAYLLKKKYGIPYVINLHGSDIHETPFTSEENKQDALLLMNNANHLIFVSQFLLNKSREFGFKGNQVSVISNGFDNELFNLQSAGDMSDSTKMVGFVGSLIQSKGVLFLPEMFHLIKKEFPEITFVIVGEGDEKENLKQQFSKLNLLNSVTFTGLIGTDKVAEQMKRMNVLVLPSYNEGFGCVLIEAQACGCKVVASENGGTVEATKSKGLIVNNGDSYAQRFALAVIELLREESDRTEVHNSVKDYAWFTTVKKEIEIYNLVINGINN